MWIIPILGVILVTRKLIEMHKLTVLLMLLTAFSYQTTFSQTPPLLTSQITYDNTLGYSVVANIETAFNDSRRSEEMQFCLAPNSITDLTLPTQTVWDNMSSDQKFLYLVNAERTSRAGLDYCLGEGPVAGLPFTGVEANIDALAQAHADSLIAVQSTSQTNQSYAIDADPNIGGAGCNFFKGTQPDCCHTFIPFAGASYSSTSFAMPSPPSTIITVGLEVRSVHAWVYGFGSTNNLRNMIMLQDIRPGNTPADPCGFVNDYGDLTDEGFIGIGVAGGVPDPNTTTKTHVDLVIFMHFDPVSQSIGCNYDCTTCVTCPSTIVENSIPIPNTLYQASNWIKSAGAVQNPTSVDMQADNFVELDPLFEVVNGAMFHAYIDGCYFTIN